MNCSLVDVQLSREQFPCLNELVDSLIAKHCAGRHNHHYLRSLFWFVFLKWHNYRSWSVQYHSCYSSELSILPARFLSLPRRSQSWLLTRSGMCLFTLLRGAPLIGKIALPDWGQVWAWLSKPRTPLTDELLRVSVGTIIPNETLRRYLFVEFIRVAHLAFSGSFSCICQ